MRPSLVGYIAIISLAFVIVYLPYRRYSSHPFAGNTVSISSSPSVPAYVPTPTPLSVISLFPPTSSSLPVPSSSANALPAQIVKPAPTSSSILSPAMAVVNYPFGITAIRSSPSIMEGWWQDAMPSWEPRTFQTFYRYIDMNTTVLDIGGWLGVTGLFAAQLAKRVIIFECDPFAMKELSLNILLNPRISQRVALSTLCIADRAMTMEMTGSGGSGSTVDQVSSDHFTEVEGLVRHLGISHRWSVDCVPLADILHQNVHEKMFVKVDVEGAEAYIIPSIIDYLIATKIRPTFYISMHSHFSHLEQKTELVKRWMRFMRLYKYVSMDGTSGRPGTEWREGDLLSCMRCDILFTDILY